MHILKALAARGHNITSLTPDVDQNKTKNIYEFHLEKAYAFLADGGDEPFDVYDMSDANPFKEQLINNDFELNGCKGETDNEQ